MGSSIIVGCALFLIIAGASAENVIVVNANRCDLVSTRKGHIQRLDCVLDPESVEGPYYLSSLCEERSNITEGKDGIPLNITFVVMDTNTCEPIEGAIVDIWHADWEGEYSGFNMEVGQTYLRGFQRTDSNGEVSFQTIYPGWYTHRCVHMHMEVFVSGNVKHIGQLYFNETITDEVRNTEPYSGRSDDPLSQARDSIYGNSGGAETTFELTGDVDNGFVGIMYIGIDNSGGGGSSGNPSAIVTWGLMAALLLGKAVAVRHLFG